MNLDREKMTDLLGETMRERTPKELALGALRYDVLRRLQPGQHKALFLRSMAGENFDGMVDELVLKYTKP